MKILFDRWWSLAIVYGSMLLLCAASVMYANYSVRESNRKFCDIVTTVNNAYKDPKYPQPTTDLGKKLKQDYAELEQRLGC